MFTQCPECQVVLELEAGNLRNAQALVRCGQCGAVFNALDNLTDNADGRSSHTHADDPDLPPPVLEPEQNQARPAASARHPEEKPQEASEPAYAELTGYDFDVEYVPGADDDEFDETSLTPDLDLAASDYDFDGDDPSSPAKEVATPGAGNVGTEHDASEAFTEDYAWQEAALQSIDSITVADFPLPQPGPSTNSASDNVTHLHDALGDPAPVTDSGSAMEEPQLPPGAAEKAAEQEEPGGDLDRDDLGDQDEQIATSAAATSTDATHSAEAANEGDWNEVADWLVEFTGGPKEEAAARRADSDQEPDPQEVTEEPSRVEAEVAPPSEQAFPARADDAPESQTGNETAISQPYPEDPHDESKKVQDEGSQTAPKAESNIQDSDLGREHASPEAETDEDLRGWVLEKEVIDVMADLGSVAATTTDRPNDGSYCLTDDIPAPDAARDHDSGSMDPLTDDLAPKSDSDERSPFDLTDESHLYETDDDGNWLTTASSTQGAPTSASRVSTVAWVGTGTLLALLLAGQSIYALAPGAPESSLMRQWARSLCSLAGCTLPLIKDTSQIVMINRSVRPHPGVENTLLITAIFRNEAPHAQPYPIVEITLSDLRGQRVGMRRFKPEEYLETSDEIALGMQPMTLVPVTLEVVEPEAEAPDFLFDFY